MTSTEYVDAVANLQVQANLTDGEVMSALAGIVVALCEKNREDPHAYIQWAIDGCHAFRTGH